MLKLTTRKGFNFFRSYYDVYNELSDKDKVAFIDALLDRQFLGTKPTNLEGMAKFAYISQTNSIDSQVKGYEDKTGIKLTPTVPPRQGGKIPPTVQVEVEVQGKEKGKVEEEVEEQTQKIEKVYSKEIHDCFNSCLSFFDSHLHPKNSNSWLETIDLLNRIDKIPFDLIIEIVKKTRQDDFWAKNFLSLTKLRKNNPDGVKYIVVFNEKIKNNGKNGTGKSKGATAEEIQRAFDKHFN